MIQAASQTDAAMKQRDVAVSNLMLTCAGDAALYKDLLRKAHGNEMVAKSWMKEICGHDGGTCSDTLIAASEAPLGPSHAQETSEEQLQLLQAMPALDLQQISDACCLQHLRYCCS